MQKLNAKHYNAILLALEEVSASRQLEQYFLQGRYPSQPPTNSNNTAKWMKTLYRSLLRQSF